MLDISPNRKDICSFSNFDEIVQKHCDIEVSLDFEKQQMYGSIQINFEILNQQIKRIVLDLKGPEISSVNYIPQEDKLKPIPLKYEIFSNIYKDSFGCPLVIDLKNLKELDKVLKAKNVVIKIDFKTTEQSNAIQFLTKEQTFSKRYPFMFTQCHAIQCRTLFPCQDTPSVKSTYTVKTSLESPMVFLFSGLLKTKFYDSQNKKSVMIFKQYIPIPTYLIAFVAGELEYGQISPRCGIWTEKGLNRRAREEFKDTEKYIQIAEKYFDHPYEWRTFNLLVLPNSFPYGGMENPNLTFVTPTLLTGEGSLINVLTHEIAHSWTGNLITNKNWQNFWVNEGFTVFMERKIVESLFGEDMANLEAIIGNNELETDVKLLGEDSKWTILAPEYEGTDPDDVFSSVPYEKGFQFLTYLEREVGKESFRDIMRNYIKKYKYQSVDDSAFKELYENYLMEKYKRKSKRTINYINWNKWITEKGMPIQKIQFDSKYIDEAEKLAQQFIDRKENPKEALNAFKNWHTNIKIVFLNYLFDKKDEYNEYLVKKLKKELKLADDYNSEIKYWWYLICLYKEFKDELPNIKNFLKTYGRVKYLRPLYMIWMEKDYNEAIKFFDENKSFYHPYACHIIQDKFEEKAH